MRQSNPPEPPSSGGAQPARVSQRWIWKICLFAASLVALISVGPIIVYPFFIYHLAFPAACYVAIVLCMFIIAPPIWAGRLGVLMGTFGLGLMALAATNMPDQAFNAMALFIGKDARSHIETLAFMQAVLIVSGYAIRWKIPDVVGWLVFLVILLVAIPRTATFATAAQASYAFVNELNSRRAR